MSFTLNCIKKLCTDLFVGSLMLLILLGNSNDLMAVDEVRVLLGNHNETEVTNMMIQFKLEDNWYAEETITIDFENDVDLSELDALYHLALERDDDDVNDDDVSETDILIGDVPNRVLSSITTATSTISLNLYFASTTIPVGTYIRLFIGPEDGMGLYSAGGGFDIISGADDNGVNPSDDFAGIAGNSLEAVNPIFLPSLFAKSRTIRGKRENTKSIGIIRIDITDSCKSLVLRVNCVTLLISASLFTGSNPATR